MKDTRRDVDSDPSLDDDDTDWSDEGGATPEGPATDPDESPEGTS